MAHPPLMLKTAGYIVSTASVLLLGLVAWDGVADKPVLCLALVAGMAASIIGMFLRWLSYWKDHQTAVKANAAQCDRA